MSMASKVSSGRTGTAAVVVKIVIVVVEGLEGGTRHDFLWRVSSSLDTPAHPHHTASKMWGKLRCVCAFLRLRPWGKLFHK